MTKQEIIDSIDDALDDLETRTLNKDVTDRMISIYTKGIMNEVVRVEASYIEDGEKQILNVTKTEKNTFVFDLSVSEAEGSGVLKITNDDDKTVLDIEIKDEKTSESIGLVFTYSISFDEKLTNINVSNSMDVDTLTNEDSYTILNSLMENPGVVKLLEDINDLSSGFGNFGYGDNVYVDEYTEDDYYYADGFGY